jgi:glycine betaine/proline transport system substrate-binding protein
LLAPAGQALAKPGVITFASVSWTGVTIKTELAVKILKVLGYPARNLMVSVPLAYKAMATGEADVFLGNWMPSMATIAEKYFKDGSVIQYCENMPGAKYTLAAPSYVVDGGLKDFADIHKYADKLEHKIYGIEEGNDGNEIIQGMIDNNLFDLGDFSLVASSEAAMLGQVRAFAKEGKWIVFLGWSPHSMNETIDMKYLTGSTAATFGPDNGTANVYTNIRKGFDKKYPNVAVLLKNLKFPIPMMNQIMARLHENRAKEEKPLHAALVWLKSHPEVYKGWFDGVTTKSGKPALPVFTAALQQVR